MLNVNLICEGCQLKIVINPKSFCEGCKSDKVFLKGFNLNGNRCSWEHLSEIKQTNCDVMQVMFQSEIMTEKEIVEEYYEEKDADTLFE